MSEKDNITFSYLFLSWSLERSNFFIAAHSYKEDKWITERKSKLPVREILSVFETNIVKHLAKIKFKFTLLACLQKLLGDFFFGQQWCPKIKPSKNGDVFKKFKATYAWYS